MSFVTTVLLVFPKAEDEEMRMGEVNQFHYLDTPLSLRSIEEASGNRDITWYGGNKPVVTNVYIGSYNHFDIRGFLDHLRSVRWENPERVQVFVQSEDEWMFNVYGGEGLELLMKAKGEKG